MCNLIATCKRAASGEEVLEYKKRRKAGICFGVEKGDRQKNYVIFIIRAVHVTLLQKSAVLPSAWETNTRENNNRNEFTSTGKMGRFVALCSAKENSSRCPFASLLFVAHVEETPWAAAWLGCGSIDCGG